MFAGLDGRGLGAELTPGGLEVHGVDQLATSVALVASSILKP